MPPPYAFAPLDVLLAGEPPAELVLDVVDDAVQWVNVLPETLKLLLLTVVLPVKSFLSSLYEKAPNPSEMPPPYAFVPLEVLLANGLPAELVLDVVDDAVQWVNVLLETAKLLLLTVVSPTKRLQPPLYE
jgi:hypothetical protein